MPEDTHSSDTRLRDLDRELRRHEQEAEAKVVATARSRPKVEGRIISARERLGRRVLLVTTLGWGVIVFGLMVLKMEPGDNPWMMVIAFPFTMAVALGCYGFQLFYLEGFRQLREWIRGRRKHSTDA